MSLGDRGERFAFSAAAAIVAVVAVTSGGGVVWEMSYSAVVLLAGF